MEKYCWLCSLQTHKTTGSILVIGPATLEIEEYMKNEIGFEKYENIAKECRSLQKCINMQ